MLVQMYLINTEQREHLKLLRENSADGISFSSNVFLYLLCFDE